MRNAERGTKKLSLVTSAATALHEEPPPYRVGQDSQDQTHPANPVSPFRFIDLFCGIGGFRLAFERAVGECVFSSDWDKHSQQTYAANFGEKPHGDIHTVVVADIPKFDILCAGFAAAPTQEKPAELANGDPELKALAQEIKITWLT